MKTITVNGEKYVSEADYKAKKGSVVQSKKSEAHHPDYSKPLEVVWYCRVHHFEAHKRGRG